MKRRHRLYSCPVIPPVATDMGQAQLRTAEVYQDRKGCLARLHQITSLKKAEMKDIAAVLSISVVGYAARHKSYRTHILY